MQEGAALVDEIRGLADSEEAGDEDLRFLPGPTEDEPDVLPLLPRARPGKVAILHDWSRAAAGLAASLARVAGRFGAVALAAGERLAHTCTGPVQGGVNDVAQNDPEVDAVLHAAGLGHLAGHFAAEDIDRAVLWSLRDSDLREMGLTLGQRRKLLDRLKADQAAPDAAPMAAEPELRRLTVMFSDLVGFTDLTTQIDPDEMRAVLQKYYAAARGAAAVFGGFIASLQGDGVVMLFGFPTTQAGSADRAIGAAHALLATLGGISHRLSDGSDIGIAARIGIASGRAIVGYPDGVTGAEPQMVGPVINRAARLQGIAAPGTVVVDEPTRTLATTAFGFVPLPDAVLKGFAQKVPVSQAIAPVASALPRVPTGPVIHSAHEPEGRALAAVWRDARAGQPVLALLTGDAGIGKSTLLAQFTTDVAQTGARVLHLGCSALSAHMPLHPVVGLLERMLGDLPGARLGALQQLLAPVSADEAEAVALLLGLVRPMPGRLTTPAEDRRLLLSVLTRFLVGAADRPCLIAVEDVHWADATTRALLQSCAQAAPATGVMLLATSRDADDAVWRDSADHLHLPLAPLDARAAGAVLSHHLSGRDLPDRIVQTILARSDGNPLMIEALARSSEGWKDTAPGQEVQVPASIYESISARLESLRVGRKVAAALAVFDEPTDEVTLALALGTPTRDLDDAVTELVDAGIVERSRGSRQASVRFRHNLYRAVCYERLVKSAREALHRAAFSALTQIDDDAGTRRPGHLALHAFEGGDHASAAPMSLAAGEQALQRSALIEAGHFMGQALTSLNRTPRTQQNDRLRLQVLVSQAAIARARQGIASDAVGQLGQQVLALAGTLGESRAELIALNGLYAHALVRAEYGDARMWVERLCDAASAAQDSTYLMIGNRGLGVVAFHTGALEDGARLLRQALDRYDEAVHAPLAHVHGYDHAEICAAFLSFTLWIMGDPAGAAKVSEFSVSHSRKIGHMHSLAQALLFRAMLCAIARDGTATLASAQEAGEVARKHGLGVMAGTSGFFAEAGPLLVRAMPPTDPELASLRQRHHAFRQVNPYNYMALTGSLLADLHLAGDAIGLAAEALLAAKAVQDRTGEVFVQPELMRLQAQALAVQGDLAAAQDSLLAAFDVAQAMGARMFALRIACDLVQADPSVQALDRLRAVQAGMISDDDGWDFRRCQELLKAACAA